MVDNKDEWQGKVKGIHASSKHGDDEVFLSNTNNLHTVVSFQAFY